MSAYTKQTWVDDDPTKPLSAARMNFIESGIQAAMSRRFLKLGVIGHSGAEPYGVWNQFGWPQRVARTVGAELINVARSGAVMGVSETGPQRGGYASSWNLFLPNDPNMSSATRRAVRRVAPYTPPADLFCIQSLSNDLGLGTDTPTKQKAMDRAQDTMESVIAGFCRAGAYFNDDDAAITYSGAPAWTNVANVPQLSTFGTGKVGGVGAYAELTTLSDFSGELVWTFIVGSAYGGQVEFRDTTAGTPGTLLGTLDMSTIGGPAASYRGTYKRINVGATGVRKIRATVTGVSGTNDGTTVTSVALNGVSVTALDALPLVVLCDHPDFPGAVAGDADMIANACVNAAAKFTTAASGYPDGRVVVGSTRAAFSNLTIGGVPANTLAPATPRSLFNDPDGHASELGHAVQTQVILNAIQAAPAARDALRAEQTAYAGPTQRIIQPYGTLLNEASYALNWAASTFALGGTGIEDDITGVQYARDSAGTVTFRGACKKTTAAATLLEQITADPIPLYARPVESIMAPTVVINAAGNAVSAGQVLIASNGHIYHLTGLTAANMQMVFSATYAADGGLRDNTHP